MRCLIKTILLQVVIILFLTTLLGQFLFAKPLSTPEENEKFQTVLDAGRSNPEIARLLEQWSSNLWVRDEKDGKLARVLQSSLLVRKILPEIKHRILKELVEITKTLPRYAGQAKAAKKNPDFQKGQYPELHALAIQAREGVHFQDPVVSELLLFVLNVLEPNAFTPSPFPNQYSVIGVNYGLMTLLDEKEQLGVLAHEWAHMKFAHSLSTLTVMAILLSAGQISIPENNPKKPLILERLSSILKTQIREWRQSEFKRNDNLAKASNSFSSAMLQDFTQMSFDTLALLSHYIVHVIRSDTHSNMPYQKPHLLDLLSAISHSMSRSLSGKRILADIQGLAKGSEEEQEVRKKELTDFLNAIIRSGEVSADHQAVHMVGGQTVARVMAKLAAGQGAELESFLTQISDEGQTDPASLAAESLGDHPSPWKRAHDNIAYEKSWEALTYQDPFLRVLDSYVAIAQRIEKQQQGIHNNDLMSPDVDVEKQISLEILQKYETDTENSIFTAIMSEFSSEKRTPPIKFLALIEYFVHLTAKGIAFPDRLNNNDGLLGILIEKLQTLNTAPANSAVKVIKKLSSLRPKPAPNPIDSLERSKLDSNGPTLKMIKSRLSPELVKLDPDQKGFGCGLILDARMR